MDYRLIEDPGHAWLEVPTKELAQLGIADKISSFSFQSRDKKFSYLEEDCDLSIFAKAKGWTFEDAHTNWKVAYCPERAFLQSFPRYSAPSD